MALTSLRTRDAREVGNLVISGLDKKLEDLANTMNADADAAPNQHKKRAEDLQRLGESVKQQFGETTDGIVTYITEMIPKLPLELTDPAWDLSTQLMKKLCVWFSVFTSIIMRLRRNLDKCGKLFGKVCKIAWAAIKLMFKYLVNPAGLLGTCIK